MCVCDVCVCVMGGKQILLHADHAQHADFVIKTRHGRQNIYVHHSSGVKSVLDAVGS